MVFMMMIIMVRMKILMLGYADDSLICAAFPHRMHASVSAVVVVVVEL